MKWPKFNAYDFYIILSVLILDIYLLYNWTTIQCPTPINWWMLLDYNLMLTLRLLFVLKYSGYKEKITFMVNVLLYAFMLPLLLAWVVLGFIWQQGNLDCIPDDMVPWSYLLWLGFTFCGVLYLIGVMIYDSVRYRRLQKYMNKIEENLSSQVSNHSSSSNQSNIRMLL